MLAKKIKKRKKKKCLALLVTVTSVYLPRAPQIGTVSSFKSGKARRSNFKKPHLGRF